MIENENIQSTVSAFDLKKALLFNKINLQNLDVFINGYLLLTLTHLEWASDLLEANTLRDGKLVSSAFQLKPVRGYLMMEQSEKIVLADFLQAKNRLLSGKVCDLVAVERKNPNQFNFCLKQLRFGRDIFVFSSQLEDLVKLEFLILGSIDWNQEF